MTSDSPTRAEADGRGAPRRGGGQVRIVVDSNADIPRELALRLDIAVVPNYVYFGSELVRDGRDLSAEAFFERMATSPVPPRTTHPPVGEFLEVYEQSLNGAGYGSVVSILVASSLSGTINSAHAAAGMLPEPGRVEILDSGQLSMGIGWVAIRAAEAAQRGATREEVVRQARSMLGRVRVAAMIDTLDNLVRGGRISQLSAALGTLLQIKPVLLVREGQVTIAARVRTRARALAKMAEEVRAWGPLSDLAVMHAGAEPLAERLAEELRVAAPELGIVVGPAGAALTAHLGLGAVGVCGLQRESG